MTGAGYDAYVTRDPYFEYEPPESDFHCSACGRFLTDEPTYTREWQMVHRCDGEPKVLDCVYGGSAHDEGLIEILGEEFRGKSYRLGYPPKCKQAEGEHEIDPDKADEHRHAPHFFGDPYGWHHVQVRVCGCGHENEVSGL